uniref:poly(ADP-ribose) glycohydrolase n=1 Tax=Globodera pallida TaxID=36090 RepID=A0A183CFC0_GLOPA
MHTTTNPTVAGRQKWFIDAQSSSSVRAVGQRLGRLFPRFNFTALFRRGTFRAVEKLQFLLHYFAQIQKCPPIGTFSVIRQCAERLPDGWEDAPLCGQLTALCEGRIEDEGAAHTQMDFANEFIGGGVLAHGAVQVGDGWGWGWLVGCRRGVFWQFFLAACLVRPRARPLLYYTFGNNEFATALHHLVHALRARHVTVGALYRMLVDYGLEVRSSFLWPARNGPKLSGVGGLFRWVHRQIFESDEADG